MTTTPAPFGPRRRLMLPSRTIVVWEIVLTLPPQRVATLERLLSSDERERAAGYSREMSRRAFTVSRAALRSILAQLCEADPAALRFEYTAQGKPLLAGRPEGPHFNLSHSGDLALVALGAEGPVGIDIERIRAVPDAVDIARRYFLPDDTEQVESASEAERDRVFLSHWTRIEAGLKATGLGLATDAARLASATVNLDIRSFIPRPGYVAAVTTPGTDWSVDFRPG